MTREEFLLKKKELNRQFQLKVDELEQKYIEESGLAGKKILYWKESYSGRFLSRITIMVFKVGAIEINANSEFCISKTKDRYELGIEFAKDSNRNLLFKKVKETYLSTDGENLRKEIGFDSVSEIDDTDFEEVAKILKEYSLSKPLNTYYDVSKYLRKAGYRPNK